MWFDEEPAEDIYLECRMRVFDRKGDIFGTMTPLKGQTFIYNEIYLNRHNDPQVWYEFIEWGDNPYLDEAFSAIKGEGAFCNGKRISVSSQPIGKALVLFGSSPYDKGLFPKTIEVLSEYFYQALDIRRSGSAALDLCSVACGRADVYFELQVSPWDFAAGKLLVEEAGGVVTSLDGESLSFEGKTSILAKNSVI